jgi:Trk-type K+ transport system membrane component
MSTRNAGFATINIHQYTDSTKMVHSILMFIGSAPSSTAGGIRTTTIAIIFLGFISRVRGKSTTSAFNRRIPTEIVTRAFIVFAVSLMLVLGATLVASSSLDLHGGKIPTGLQPPGELEPYNFADLFFEISSAFGTTGLSTGITTNLNDVTKIMLILLMFIGQLGVSSTILV